MTQWGPGELPFFEDANRRLAERAMDWASPVPEHVTEADLPEACRRIARSLGEAGLLAPLVAGEGGAIGVRDVCVVREIAGYKSALADAVAAMQGIGTYGIAEYGTQAQKDRYLGPAARGEAIAAFALTEPATGSDVAAIATTAVRDGDGWVLEGEKAYISNAGIADHYVVLARTGEAPGSRGLTAFVVDADAPGLHVGPPVALMAAHPIAGLRFDGCRIGAGAQLGPGGGGFKLAMRTFDVFRTSVGAAAVGMARRAMDETLAWVGERRLFGGAMTDIPGIQTAIAEMSVDLDLAALAVYRAAWTKDCTGERGTREASMAKLVGTEGASRVIDRAVQLFGGAGVTRGFIVEQLYRDIRATRIYEGASEVQKLIIGRSLLREGRA